jgi:zinc transporter ZupT
VALNPNYVPWMSILGIAGMVIGFVIGGGSTDPQGMIPALYGLLAGSFAGIVIRIVVRSKSTRQEKSDDQSD